jgi:hypothetical protein
MNSLRRQFLRAPDVVHVIGVTAINEDIAGFQQREQIGDGLVHDRRRHH